jgi:hypothetical protein
MNQSCEKMKLMYELMAKVVHLKLQYFGHVHGELALMVMEGVMEWTKPLKVLQENSGWTTSGNGVDKPIRKLAGGERDVLAMR